MNVQAPWTDDQVKCLNDFQQAGYVHPFTCGGEDCRMDLIATNNGWICPSGCGYTQNWAHDYMLVFKTNPDFVARILRDNK